MALTPADPALGHWIGPRLAAFGPQVGAIVPQGFEAYARILHPVQVDTDAWETWAEVAHRAGTELEATAVWWRVAGLSAYRDQAEDNPEEGNLPRHAFVVLRELLARESGQDASCVAAVWNGWGHLHEGRAIFGWRVNGTADPDPPDPPAGPFPQEVLDGPVLDLPSREYFTFACTLATVEEPCVYDQWAAGDGAGWQSPQLLWPLDRAWCVATEVDFDSTFVGGPARLVDAIRAEPRLETFRVSPSDTFDY